MTAKNVHRRFKKSLRCYIIFTIILTKGIKLTNLYKTITDEHFNTLVTSKEKND